MSNKDESLEPRNHLKDAFYTTPKFASQVMTLKQWKETMLHTQGRILACGETWELKQEYLGGSMRRVTVELTYWKGGRPPKKTPATAN